MAAENQDQGVTLRLVKNVSAETMPRHALFRVTGVDGDGVIQVNKPDTDGKSDGVNWNGPVDAGDYGQVTFDSPAVVLYDSASGTPAAGDEWGAAAGSWKATAGKTGWKVYGGGTAVTTPANSGLVLAGRVLWPGGGTTTGWTGTFTFSLVDFTACTSTDYTVTVSNGLITNVAAV